MSRKNEKGGNSTEFELAETLHLDQSVRADGAHQNDEEKQLLAIEDAPSGVHVISAACQSLEKSKGVSSDEDEDDPSPFYQANYYQGERWTSIPYAFLTLILAIANLLWSVGLTYWNFRMNNFDVAVASLVIIILSGSITTIAFFATNSFPSRRARDNLWHCSKFAWLLAAIPTLVPIVLSAVYFLSSVLNNGSHLTNEEGRDGDKSSKNEQRQCAKSETKATSQLPLIFNVEEWRACTVAFFLIESLTLCFPMAVIHLVALLEDPNSLPSLIGMYSLFGQLLFTFSITYTRFHCDSTEKRDRFGDGTEKYLRFGYLWSAKIIWLVTYAIFVVTARVAYQENRLEATILAVAGLTAVHEIPLWICLIPKCSPLAVKVSALFFLIPQFTSLMSLIFWVNTDPTVYQTNIASVVLGVYFWSEAVMLCGWLVDGNADKDIDLVPLYPHLFGDFISSCFISKKGKNPQLLA